MEVIFVGRNRGITDRFREYVTEKSKKVTRIASRASRLDVKITHDHDERGGKNDNRVELTLVGVGPIVRAESEGDDKYVAFDHALVRLLERVRRANDRKKVHRGKHRPMSLREASADGFRDVDVTPVDAEILEKVRSGEIPVALSDSSSDSEEEEIYSPVVIRTKVFSAAPMTVDDALYFMELVGHDFYLFVDLDSGRPSVVYRRKGWDYGVIGLDNDADDFSGPRPVSRQSSL